MSSETIFYGDCSGWDQNFICCMCTSGNIICAGLCCLLWLFNRGVKAFHVLKIFHVVCISGFHFFYVWEFSGGSAGSKLSIFYRLHFWWPERKDRQAETFNGSRGSCQGFRILVLSCIVILEFCFLVVFLFWFGSWGKLTELLLTLSLVNRVSVVADLAPLASDFTWAWSSLTPQTGKKPTMPSIHCCIVTKHGCWISWPCVKMTGVKTKQWPSVLVGAVGQTAWAPLQFSDVPCWL